MLSCKEVSQLSSEFIDKRLSLKQRLRFFIHMLMCGHCRRYIRQLRTMIQKSRGLYQGPASDITAEQILNNCKQRKEHTH